MATDQIHAVMMVKDEADIIRQSIEHVLASGIDAVHILDNDSHDGTTDIIHQLRAEHPRQVFYYHDPEVAYYQSRKMTRLAAVASKMGAEWIVPMDCDEVFYSWSGRSLADEIRATSASVIGTPLWNHFVTDRDTVSDDPFKRMTWRDKERGQLDKIIYRYHSNWTIDQGNHGLTDEQGRKLAGVGISIGIRHFPYRSTEQFIRKVRNGAAAYAQTNLAETTGAHWRMYGNILDKQGEQGLIDHFNRWFVRNNPAQHDMIYDPAPVLRREYA